MKYSETTLSFHISVPCLAANELDEAVKSEVARLQGEERRIEEARRHVQVPTGDKIFPTSY